MEQKRVSLYQFVKQIADDCNIELNKKIKTFFEEFPVINGVRKINFFGSSVIVDREGNEYPYMIDRNKRNEEKLKDFDCLYITRCKFIEEIEEEIGIKLKREKCKISEGEGYYSMGTRYFYKDLTCEF